MQNTTEDPRRIEVWVAMAHHFLDTETRHDIPLTAMRCVEADLTTAEARDVWRYEVSPAVEFNLWDVAGEWACWDRDWLVERIGNLRSRWDGRRRTLGSFRYRSGACLLHGVWLSIERCLGALLAVPLPGERERLSRDLEFLARHYFDFCPDDFAALEASHSERIRSLYPKPFKRLLSPALVLGEGFLANRRVRAALKRNARP